jgi:hypothetical protein
MEHHIETAKNLGDGASIAAIVASYFAWLPHPSALLAGIYISIRIWETKTVQGLVAYLREWLREPPRG